MKQEHGVLTWLVEGTKARSVAVLEPDGKGRLATLAVEAMAKNHRIFSYYGVNIPRNIIRELGAKFPGAAIDLIPDHACNADLVWLAEKKDFPRVWHNRIVAFHGPSTPGPGFGRVKGFEVWLNPLNSLPPRQFQVKTRNCVDDGIIQQNLCYSLHLGLPNLPRCKAHGHTAVVLSAGPSLVNHLEEIKARKEAGDFIFCVKHSHDLLLDAGIVPYGCMLLDPRAHVKDFIENPHPEVVYIVSTTCNPTTYDRLLSRNSRIWTYHALVGAGEENMVRLFNETTRATLQKGELEPYRLADHLIPGGTTAASRGISVLHVLGFRKFALYGFDSCYWEKPDMSLTKEDGQPRYHELAIAGRKWWTDAELVAQVQDFQSLVPNFPDCTFEPAGDGIVPTVIRAMPRYCDNFPDFLRQ